MIAQALRPHTSLSLPTSLEQAEGNRNGDGNPLRAGEGFGMGVMAGPAGLSQVRCLYLSQHCVHLVSHCSVLEA